MVLTTPRAVGTTVYVALNNNLYGLPGPIYTVQGDMIVYETEAQYRASMEALPLDALLPHSTTMVNGQPVTQLLSSAADIYQAGVAADTNLLSVVSLDLNGTVAGPTHSVSFLTSYNATLYAASDNFYLVTSRWSYVNTWTFIDKLSLANDGIDLTATGQVLGSIVNQFSMGEDGAYFDIATTSGGWGDGSADKSNNVFVLAENDHALDIVGRLENIAPGESITSVRFLGARGFVSTFYQRDPLFALDLSDPANPRIAGELQLPGYTSYLQLLDSTHLLGVGQEPGSTTGWNWGVVITLYDITDLNNPTVLSQYHVSAVGWSWSAAAYDYHAITYYPEYQALTLPVTTSVQVTNGTDTQWIYQSSELVFHVDSTGLNYQGRVNDVSTISRGVFINNTLYTISDTSIQVHSLDNLTQLVAQAPLPPPVYYFWWGIWGWRWANIPVQPLTIAVSGDPLPSTAPLPAPATTTPLNDKTTAQVFKFDENLPPPAPLMGPFVPMNQATAPPVTVAASMVRGTPAGPDSVLIGPGTANTATGPIVALTQSSTVQPSGQLATPSLIVAAMPSTNISGSSTTAGALYDSPRNTGANAPAPDGGAGDANTVNPTNAEVESRLERPAEVFPWEVVFADLSSERFTTVIARSHSRVPGNLEPAADPEAYGGADLALCVLAISMGMHGGALELKELVERKQELPRKLSSQRGRMSDR